MFPANPSTLSRPLGVEKPRKTRSNWQIMQTTESLELEGLLNMGSAGLAAGATDMDHLDGAAAAFNYIRIAELVNSYYQSGALQMPVLDWGCGYGQVSWLLKRRGLSVVSCDVEKRPARQFIEILNQIDITYLQDPLRLPYDPASFGGVLSVGVLEHVGESNVEASLAEIARVVRPGGYFFIFMLPNRFSWVEFLSDLRGVSVHPDKYTFGRIERLLRDHGFAMERKWRRNVLPRNLTGLSHRLKLAYGRHYRRIEAVDHTLSNVWPFAISSGVIEVVARKT
jgi:SAM-dependent methyltransferase